MASINWLLRIAPMPLIPRELASCFSSGRTIESKPEPLRLRRSVVSVPCSPAPSSIGDAFVISAISVNVCPCQFGHVLGAHPWRGDTPTSGSFVRSSAHRDNCSRYMADGDALELCPRRT